MSRLGEVAGADSNTWLGQEAGGDFGLVAALEESATGGEALRAVAKTFRKMAVAGAQESRRRAGEAIWLGLTSKQTKDNSFGKFIHKSHNVLFGDMECESGGARDSTAWNRSTAYLNNLKPHGRFWKSFSSGLRDYSSDAVDILCEIDLDEETREQIEKDLPRTFPTLTYYSDPDVMNSMKRVLTAAANQLPDVGYVQGMNILVGYIFLHVKTETEAFELLMDMMLHPRYNLRAVFLEGLPNLVEFSHILEKLVRELDPEVYEHLESIGLGSFIFCYQWIITLFTYSMPFDEVAKVWDLFFEYGWVAMFKAFIALILCRRSELLNSDFEQAFEMIRDSPANPPSDFISRINSVSLTPTMIEQINQAVRNGGS